MSAILFTAKTIIYFFIIFCLWGTVTNYQDVPTIADLIIVLVVPMILAAPYPQRKD